MIPIAAVLLLLQPAAGATGKPLKVAIEAADAYQLRSGAWVLDVEFTEFLDAKAWNPASYHLVDLLGCRPPATQCPAVPAVTSVEGEHRPDSQSVTLKLGQAPAHEHFALVVSEELTFSGGHPQKEPPLVAVVHFVQAADLDRRFKLAKAKGRDDANVYISGNLARPAGDKPWNGAVDVKAERPFRSSAANTLLWWGPSFSASISSQPGSDPDSLRAGLGIHTYLGDSYRWRGMVSGTLEGDRGLKQQNGIAEARLSQIVLIGPPGRRLTWIPFVGAELGKNITSPVPEAEGKGIRRLLLGSAALWRWPNIIGTGSSLDLTVDYTARFLKRDEATFTEGDDGELALLNVEKRTRSFFKAEADLMVSKLFGFKAAYETGEVPPVYKRVDRKASVGFVYKAAWKR